MEPYLLSYIDSEQIYYLNKAGREAVGASKVITRNAQAKHTLMRNDIYIHFGCPEYWESELPIKTQGLHFIPDAVFVSNSKCYFLEVDNLQKMNANKNKLENYLKFKNTGLYQRQNNGAFPTLLFYTLTESRKAQLQELNPGLDLKVFTKKDLFVDVVAKL